MSDDTNEIDGEKIMREIHILDAALRRFERACLLFEVSMWCLVVAALGFAALYFITGG